MSTIIVCGRGHGAWPRIHKSPKLVQRSLENRLVRLAEAPAAITPDPEFTSFCKDVWEGRKARVEVNEEELLRLVRKFNRNSRS